MLRIASPAVALLALSACVDLDDDRRGGGGYRERVEYRCDDDRRFDVTFRDRGREAVVRTGDDSYRLELEDRDGRRLRYGSGDVQLTVDRGVTRLRIKDQRDFSGCEER
ncbi:MAG TPA: hypothetical protein VF606_01135 [Geminicoccaceae bacterium]